MAGYNGYSKSNNAMTAEGEGRYPLTTAARTVARETGITVKEARALLEEIGTSEYHHSSKFYNSVDYYDTGLPIRAILYAHRTGAPVGAVFEMIEENGVDILTTHAMNHVEERRSDAQYRRDMARYKAECVCAKRSEEERKREADKIKAACPHMNARVIHRTLPGGIVEPAYRKCPDCHTNYLPL